jgi:transposase
LITRDRVLNLTPNPRATNLSGLENLVPQLIMAPDTTPETKAMIIALKKLGFSNRAVAEKLGTVSHATVGRVMDRYSSGLPLDQKAPRSGRPHKLTLQDVRYAALALARFKPHNAATLQRTCFPHISTPTLCRYLCQLGLRSYRRRKVPLLKYKQRKSRFGWVRTRLLWPQALWDDIVFSDEVRMELFGPDGSQYYWRYPNESPYDPRYTKKLVSHGGGSIFLWGCIMREGVGRLHCIDGIMNAANMSESFARHSLAPWQTTNSHHLTLPFNTTEIQSIRHG